MNILTTNKSDDNTNFLAMSKMDKLYNDMAEYNTRIIMERKEAQRIEREERKERLQKIAQGWLEGRISHPKVVFRDQSYFDTEDDKFFYSMLKDEYQTSYNLVDSIMDSVFHTKVRISTLEEEKQYSFFNNALQARRQKKLKAEKQKLNELIETLPKVLDNYHLLIVIMENPIMEHVSLKEMCLAFC